jgi:Bax protein
MTPLLSPKRIQAAQKWVAAGLVFAMVAALFVVAWNVPPTMVFPLMKAQGGGKTQSVILVEPLVEAVIPVVSRRSDRPADEDALFGDELSANGLSAAFARINYRLDEVIAGKNSVPRLFISAMPPDLQQVVESRRRKVLFFQTMLPLVLQANEEILKDRRRLWGVSAKINMGLRLDGSDRLWLSVMADRYRVKDADIEKLLIRMDIIPPSQALAQAAEESGWGTSRFVRQGNAIFGQWTASQDTGLVPLKRDPGMTHKVKTFETLLDSVRAYMRNLNTHRVYGDFRKMRARIRRDGAPLDGWRLTGYLEDYSQRGMFYINDLRSIIKTNGLSRLDGVRLKTSASSYAQGT